MRTFIFAVAAMVAASWAIDQAPAADRIPTFDIVRNCSAEVASVAGTEIADCTKDEIDAKNELDKRWPQFSASNKRRREQHWSSELCRAFDLPRDV